MGGYQEKHTKQGKVAMQIKVIVFSIEKSFQRLSHPALPGTERDTSFQMEIFLLDGRVSSQRVTSTQF